MSETVLKLDAVTKTFPSADTNLVVANDSISLELKKGEVLCLLGENGAGKSTLISILAGLQKADSGSIEIAGKTVNLSSPKVSLAHGIGVVYQHSALIPTMSVLENLMLQNTGNFLLNPAEAEKKLLELGELLGAEIDPHTPVSSLGLGQRQQVEIAKALWQGSTILIFDEPTSMLTPKAVESLIRSIKKLKKQDISIIFVTHKLHEAVEVGDEFAVLRAGKVTARLTAAEMKNFTSEEAQERVFAAMFSEEVSRKPLSALPQEFLYENDYSDENDTAIRLQDVSTVSTVGETPIENVSLEVHAGEIFGVAGIDGHGQKHLAEVIAGQLDPQTGQVLLGEGKTEIDITRFTVKERQRLGVRYVTDDRLDEGIVGSFSVALNLVLKKIGEKPFWKLGRLNRNTMINEAKKQIASFDIRTPSPQAPAGNLSGGNIQKLLLARELEGKPSVVVINKPTYGLDLKTVGLVQKALQEFASRGGAVILISTDLDELTALADRIAVIADGEIVGEIVNEFKAVVAEKVGELMVAGKRKQQL